MLFFLYFFWKWVETFTFGEKQYLYSTHSFLQCFEKLALKKKNPRKLLGHVSKSRANLESRLTFSESLFNFLQSSITYCVLYSHGYIAENSVSCNPWLCCQQLAGLKRLMISQKRLWICSFFCIFLKRSWHIQQITILHVIAKAIS